MNGFSVLGLLWVLAMPSPGKMFEPPPPPREEEPLPPLDEMYHEESGTWSWQFIHIRCAAVYLIVQSDVRTGGALNNRYMDVAQLHALVAARYWSDMAQLSFEAAYGEVEARVHETSYIYLEIAEQERAMAPRVLKEPVFERDLKFCDRLELR